MMFLGQWLCRINMLRSNILTKTVPQCIQHCETIDVIDEKSILEYEKIRLTGEVSVVLLPLSLSLFFAEVVLPKFLKLAFTLS
jgi:hypothetical protein